MRECNLKPKGGIAVAVITWLLVAAAVCVVVFILPKEDASLLSTLVFFAVPVILAVPALIATYGLVVSKVNVRGSKLTYVTTSAFRRYVFEMDLSEIEAVWHYRRTVVDNHNRLRSAYGLAFRRAGGEVLHMDLSLYTDAQRRTLAEAVLAAATEVEQLPLEGDRGTTYRAEVGAPQWQKPADYVEPAPDRALAASDLPAEAQPEQSERQVAASAATPGEPISSPAKNPILYRYTPYEGESSARCHLCGARIAAATTPGDHETAGYLSQNGKKWVCKACWARFAKDYCWKEE